MALGSIHYGAMLSSLQCQSDSVCAILSAVVFAARENHEMTDNYRPKCPLCHKPMQPIARETEEKDKFANPPRKWQCDECMALRTTLW